MLNEIFKAYDVRGKVGSELTVEIAEEIGKAFADWVPQEGPIAIGRDMRVDSAQLSQALIRGITSQGRDVVDIGLVTSDMIYFAVGKFGYAGGMMVTASHNPGEYNGIKFCREEAKPVGIESGLAEVRDMVEKKNHKPSERVGQSTQKDVKAQWIEHVLSFVNPEEMSFSKIAIDAGNGMAGTIVPLLNEKVPWRVVPMFFELDGTFPNHPANPIDPANLRELQVMVEKERCHLGIAFDGDGDRAVLVDEKGGILTGTMLTALLADYFLDKNPGATVLCNAICGLAVDEVVKNKGGKLVRTKVGHSFIKQEMLNNQAVFAGEHSGHYYFKDNWNADSGLIAAVIAVAIFGKSKKLLSELVEPYKKFVAIPETNFQVEDKDQVINRIADAFTDGEREWLDGLTIRFGDSWFNVRPSNTEPLLRFNAEAVHGTRLNDLVNKVSGIISGQNT